MNTNEYIEKRSKTDKRFAEEMKRQDELMPIAVLFLKIRADEELSQEALAALLGVSKQELDDWEKCRKAPNSDILPKLANISHQAITITFEPDSNLHYG